jgi:peptide/nickel transport system substrate-binding protein
VIDTPDLTRAPSTKRVFRLAAVAAAVSLATLGLAQPALAASEAPSGDILKIATAADIDTLNPFTTILSSGTSIMSLEYESLVQFSAADNSIVPGMASKWSTSSDGLTWTFTIPEGRTWSDGKPVTAEDAAFTYTSILTKPELQQAHGGDVGNVEKAVAKNDTTLVLTLKEAQAPNPGSIVPIVPEHIWSKVGDPATFANDKDAVGSGPFTVKSYAQSQSVQLVANKNFWRGAPKIDGITYVYYKNGDAEVQGLRTGEVDIVSGLQPAQYEALKGVKNIALNAGSGRRHTALAINPGAKDAKGAPLGNGNPALQDKTLRTAIVMAIDKKTLLAKVGQGLGKLGETEIPPVYPTFFGIDKSEVIPYDPAKANSMLDAAGYTKGADGIRLDKTGKPLDLRLLGRSSNPQHTQMADYIVPWLKDIGIKATFSTASDNQVNDESTLGKYDMYFTGWGVDPDPDSQLVLNLCSSMPNADGSGATSENNWCDPSFDKLYEEQHTELDPQKRSELVKQAMAVLYTGASNTVIWYSDSLEAYRSDRFTGFQLQPAKSGVITAQNGYWGLYSATPVGSASASDDGPNVGLIVGIVIGVLVIAGIVVLLVLRRRRTTADDRE